MFGKQITFNEARKVCAHRNHAHFVENNLYCFLQPWTCFWYKTIWISINNNFSWSESFMLLLVHNIKTMLSRLALNAGLWLGSVELACTFRIFPLYYQQPSLFHIRFKVTTYLATYQCIRIFFNSDRTPALQTKRVNGGWKPHFCFMVEE